MILTCPKCSNRYHIDSVKTGEVVIICPSCSHQWITKRTAEIPPLLLNAPDEIHETMALKHVLWEKFKQNKKFFIMLSVFSLTIGYLLQPLLKVGFQSLLNVLRIQNEKAISLSPQNIDYFFDENAKTVTISWELKNNSDVSVDLNPFKIKIFTNSPKNIDDYLQKEVKFTPNKDIILPKEILRFEHTEKCSMLVTKVDVLL